MFAWAVVDVFVEQLSVPYVVAQTVGPQKHQQRPTKLPCQHWVGRSFCGPLLFAWAVVDVFVERLSKTSTTAHTTTMSTLIEPQFLWAVVDVFVDQLSVPPVVAQTVGPQKHQQRPTQLPCQH